MIVSIEAIDNILPQTQCQKCTYPDCYSYAKAITNGEKHNKCITGGEKTLKELSELLAKPGIPLDENLDKAKPRAIAKIDENMCVGCTKCILACPVDAIVGAKNFMHTIVESECTGCELCIEPCPMDCISLIDLVENKQPQNLSQKEYNQQKKDYRDRYEFHKRRVKKTKAEQRDIYKSISSTQQVDKKAYIAASLAKLKAKKKISIFDEQAEKN